MWVPLAGPRNLTPGPNPSDASLTDDPLLGKPIEGRLPG
jgi:hypothetical protein